MCYNNLCVILSISTLKDFSIQRSLIFVLGNVKGPKLKSLPEIPKLQNTTIGDAINLVLGLLHILLSSFTL